MTSLLLCLALVAGLLQGLPVTAKAADSHGNDIGIGTTWFVGDKIDLGDSLYDQWFLARPDVKAYRNKFGKGEAVVPEPDKWQYLYEIGYGDWVWRFHECLHAFAQTETGIITIPYSMYFKVDEENPDRKPIGFRLMKDDVYYFEPMYTHTHDNKTFLPWNESSILPSDAGNYYLTDDVALYIIGEARSKETRRLTAIRRRAMPATSTCRKEKRSYFDTVALINPSA